VPVIRTEFQRLKGVSDSHPQFTKSHSFMQLTNAKCKKEFMQEAQHTQQTTTRTTQNQDTDTTFM